MPRPYVSWSIERLEALFEVRRGNLDVVLLLKEELTFRKTKRAQKLLAEVLACTDKIERDSGEAVESEPVVDLPPAEEVDEVHRRSSLGDLLKDTHIEESHGSATGKTTEQPPDDRRRPNVLSLIRPLGTPGLPPAWIRPLDASLSLNIPTDADLPRLYVAALSALIEEIKKTGAGQKRYELENGIRVEGNASDIIYDFVFPDAADLFEDAKVEVELPGRRIDASIISISSGHLWLATKEDLGATLSRAVIVIDATALLEALKEKIEQAGKGELPFNRNIADAVVGRGNLPPPPAAIPRAMSATNLNDAQVKALSRALSTSITYIWGPPGCGKTHLLGEVVRSAFEDGKRILISSNTNTAVDQVLFKICKGLGERHPAMEEGRIVRLGRVVDDKHKGAYKAYVTIDGIVDRKSAELKASLNRAQEEIARIDGQTARAKETLNQFTKLDTVQRAVDSHCEATNELARSNKELNTTRETVRLRIADLETDLREPRSGLFRWFKPSKETIQKNIMVERDRQARLSAEIEKVESFYAGMKQRFDAAKVDRDHIAEQLRGKDRVAAEQEIAEADLARAPLVEKVREIEAKLADIRAAILKDAKVLGATCTKTYLAAKEIGKVDMVIIDEASMVLLPMVWFTAGMATERVVICGDFRQIPPIVQTRQQAVFDVLGGDVFEAAELTDPVPNDRMEMLDLQYRMDDKICQLISAPMYGGQLKTAPKIASRQIGRRPPPPYDGTFTIVDTSDLWPFESVNAYFSRFNLMHALLVRNLAWHLRREGYIQDKGDLAICTPYAAQAKLIRKLLEHEDLGDVPVGTVHSFQGDERDAVVLEFPEGYGGARMVGQFLQGIPPKDVGARLINVAISRAKNHLIVLANLTYLDPLLPSSALLRGILHSMQQNGRVVRGSELLELRPIESDMRGLIGVVDFDFNASTFGLFSGHTIERAIESDIANAKESVVIFSGFVTPARVGKLGDLLRLKVSEHVKVRCVTRPPDRNGTMDPALGKEALDLLEAVGCTIDCRARIHEKIVIIDKEIVWHGSLNVLSHTHLTDESMTRVVNKGFAQAVAVNMSKLHVSSEAALQAVTNAENPRCPVTGHRTVYYEGRFGPYFKCESSRCDWKTSLKNAERNSSRHGVVEANAELPLDGPMCPLCGSKTRLRSGRFGRFYGCIKYPHCPGKCAPPRANRKVGRSRFARKNSTA
jgi:hypothetical protein